MTMTKKGFTLIEHERSKSGGRNEGFTLIELLIVIGILAILMGTVIVAINPFRQFAQARNSQRWAHTSSILTAVYQNIVDNKGTFVCATGLPTSATYMKADDGNPATTEYDICSCLAPTYLAEMPYDPSVGAYSNCTSYDTGYQISQNATTNRITVSAPSAELGETISVTR